MNVWQRESKKELARTSILLIIINYVSQVTVVNPWAEPRDAEEVDERMVKMKADLLSEVIAVSDEYALIGYILIASRLRLCAASLRKQRRLVF